MSKKKYRFYCDKTGKEENVTVCFTEASSVGGIPKTIVIWEINKCTGKCGILKFTQCVFKNPYILREEL